MRKFESGAGRGASEKMADSLLSPQARRDLLEIWEYISQDDLDRADRVEQNIYEAISKLVANPQLGHYRRDLTSKPVRFGPFTLT